jgi:AraC-like DNA-binding protein
LCLALIIMGHGVSAMSSAADHAELPGVYALDVIELAGRWNVRAEAMLDGLGLSTDALRDPAARVPIEVCTALVERAQRLTGEPALAVYMGMQMRLSSHGFLGFAAMTAATIREAIALAVRFSATRTSAIGLSFYTEGDTAALVIEERTPLGGLREFAVLGLIVGLWQIGQALTGRVLSGVAECGFPAPEFVGRVPFMTSDFLRFGQPANRLVFSTALLDLPLKSADPVAMQLARAQCERELAAIVDAGFPGRVRAAITGDGDVFRDLGAVATLLHVSTRTLKRRLAEQGTSFSDILDDVRRQRALLLLENRELAIAEVAARLGYTEVPNFTRAFRRWTGRTPAAYRGR